MLASDLIFYLTRDVGPAVLLLCCVVGASRLWKRTRLASALVQLLAASLVFVSWAVHITRIEFTTPFDTSSFARVLGSEAMQITETLTLLIGVVVFVFGYLWYALAQKASNQASLQRTAPRSDA
jgi:hypothetical protein